MNDSYAKNYRHQLILKILEEQNIGTQEGLKAALMELGCKVTQATVSRDIKELALIKSVSPQGEYMYCVPSLKKDALDSDGNIIYTIISDAVKKVDSAMNTVVVRCNTGMAQAVCAKLDEAPIDNVVGTLAGDDTIFILMRTERDAERLVKELTDILRSKY